MVCVYCGNKTAVINSRHRQNGLEVWRRRTCSVCKAVFTTLEQIDSGLALMVKKSSQYQPFLRDKLFLSIYDSLKHRKTALADATALTDTSWSKLVPAFVDGKIERGDIVEIVIPILKRFDHIAATHYTAFHSSD